MTTGKENVILIGDFNANPKSIS